MIVGALASALAPGFVWLVVARFVLGLGIGGDYPVSAVLMSEYSNRKDRGRLVGSCSRCRPLGLIVGPLVGLALLASGIGHDLTWRLLLGLRGHSGRGGHLPALEDARVAAVTRPQSRAQAEQAGAQAARSPRERSMPSCPDDATPAHGPPGSSSRNRQMLTPADRHRRHVVPLRLRLLRQHPVAAGDPEGRRLPRHVWSPSWRGPCGIFVVFALPGYVLAVMKMDRIGHRRLQLIGFAVMARRPSCPRGHPGTHDAVVPFLARLRSQLLLHRVRAEHDNIRASVRGVPREQAEPPGTALPPASGSSGHSSGSSSSPSWRNTLASGHAARGGRRLGPRLPFDTDLPEPARRTLEEVSVDARGQR